MRRTSILLLSILCVFLGASRHYYQSAVQSTQPVNGDWAVVQFPADPDGLNPITSVNGYGRTVEYGVNYSLVYETLLQYDIQNNWRFGKPLLAEAYPEISPDHLSYTFKIRAGVKWHDGKSFTADDVVFSAKATVCPGVDDASARNFFTDMLNAEVLPGSKVRFTFSKPYFLNDVQLGTLYIVPKHIFDADGLLDNLTLKDLIGAKGQADPNVKKFAEQFNKHPNNRQPIGTGPFKFEKWDTGKEIRLVRNSDYWAKKPYLDRVIFRTIQDQTAALTALKAGEVDLVPILTPVQYTQQTSGPQFDNQLAKAKYSNLTYFYIGWNEEKPLFKDKRVRQALTMLVPRQQIIDTLRFGLARIGVTHFTPDSPDFDPNLKALPYDPKRAGQLLDEAGWKDTNGDGIRDKDGVPFRFEFLAASSNAFADQLLPVLKEEFRKAGIDMTEKRVEFTLQVNMLKDHNFDAFSGAWSSPFNTDPYQIWYSGSAKDRGSNFISYNNPEVDKILERARMEFDPMKRKPLYWRLQEILHDEQPYTFLFYPQNTAAYSKRFQNISWLPVTPGYDLTSWFVPKALQKYKDSPRP